MNTDIVAYYRKRANEYEKIYQKPERQEELAEITELLQNGFANKTVFEIACGTGFWTQRISESAVSVFATDVNEEVLDIAMSKLYRRPNVHFEKDDIFNLQHRHKHEALFGGFIWSHIKLDELKKFIDICNKCVRPGGTIVFIDNNYVAGSNHPITDTDDEGNTFQTRWLTDGSIHQVLKNFPDKELILKVLDSKATDINFVSLKYYWLLQYKTPM